MAQQIPETFSHLIGSSESVIYTSLKQDSVTSFHKMNIPVIENYNIITIDSDDIIYAVANNYLEKLIFDKL